MKLYYFETLNPRKACAVARYLNSPVEFVRIDLGKGENRTPEYLAINPNGKVPALTDGDRKIWEANAIMAYLARAARLRSVPADDRQIEVTRWLSWNADHFTRHAGNLYFQHIIKPHFGLGEPDPKEVEEATGILQKVRPGAQRSSARAENISSGDTLTIADFAVAVTLPLCGQGQHTGRRIFRDRALARPAQRAAGLAPAVPRREIRGRVSTDRRLQHCRHEQ